MYMEDVDLFVYSSNVTLVGYKLFLVSSQDDAQMMDAWKYISFQSLPRWVCTYCDEVGISSWKKWNQATSNQNKLNIVVVLSIAQPTAQSCSHPTNHQLKHSSHISITRTSNNLKFDEGVSSVELELMIMKKWEEEHDGNQSCPLIRSHIMLW